MAEENAIAGAEPDFVRPEIHSIKVTDIKDILSKGIDDFSAHPTHRLFLTIIYPFVAVFAIRLGLGYEILPLIFPMIAGFALVGPFAAIGMYGLSRRHETHPAATWKGARDAFQDVSLPSLIAMGAILTVLFFIWLFAAEIIYTAIFGDMSPDSVMGFANELLMTERGWTLIIVGHTVGLIFAVMVLAISVISFPMLVDRNVGIFNAIETSVRAVVANPLTMAVWGIVVAGAIIIGTVPFFIGLCVVFPVLGHATWHLYRKVVVY